MSTNRCDRCNRELKDQQARYGWRCADKLGWREIVNRTSASTSLEVYNRIVSTDSFRRSVEADKYKRYYYPATIDELISVYGEELANQYREEKYYEISPDTITMARRFAERFTAYRDYIGLYGKSYIDFAIVNYSLEELAKRTYATVGELIREYDCLFYVKRLSDSLIEENRRLSTAKYLIENGIDYWTEDEYNEVLRGITRESVMSDFDRIVQEAFKNMEIDILTRTLYVENKYISGISGVLQVIANRQLDNSSILRRITHDQVGSKGLSYGQPLLRSIPSMTSSNGSTYRVYPTDVMNLGAFLLPDKQFTGLTRKREDDTGYRLPESKSFSYDKYNASRDAAIAYVTGIGKEGVYHKEIAAAGYLYYKGKSQVTKDGGDIIIDGVRYDKYSYIQLGDNYFYAR